MRKIINIPKSIQNKFLKKYIETIIIGKFIILTDTQILILKKPLVVNNRGKKKKYIFIVKDIVYKIISFSDKDEIKMQILVKNMVKKYNIKVKIPEIKWWSNYKNFTIIAMEKAKGTKIINKPYLYKRIVNIKNALNKNNLYHNDWNKGNVLYDIENDDLWLIDFDEASTKQNRFTNLTKFLA